MAEVEDKLLKIEDLRTFFYIEDNVFEAVDGIYLDIGYNEILGLVGESGSGKSVTALSILRLIQPPGKIISGDVYFKGNSLFGLSEKEMRRFRGEEISMIFQSAKKSLNPRYRIGHQVARVFKHHLGLDDRAAKDEALKMLKMVAIPDAEKAYNSYPHQFSGGMCQRIAISKALACSPKLLIADEPTTGLDVTIEAQIIELLRDLKEQKGISILLITHDLGIVAKICEKVAVMHAGHIVEVGNTLTIFNNPAHPYTIALQKAVLRSDKKIELRTIPGEVPNLKEAPKGCRFFYRCEIRDEKCLIERPPHIDKGDGHIVFCHKV